MSGLDGEDAAEEFRRRHNRLTAGLDIGDVARIVRWELRGTMWCKRCGRDLSHDEIFRHHRHDGQLSWPQRWRVLFTGFPPR